MLTKRSRDERGPTDAGWLKSQHSFSFGHYYDPNHRGYGPLRVINEDYVAPGAGFETHSHNNMEIISYVLEGELAHKDSMGNGSVIRPGDIQLMSAGAGVQHSEFNYSKTDNVHFLQIWIVPNEKNINPSYQQKSFADSDLRNQFRVVISADGAHDSLLIHQDASMLAGRFDKDTEITWATKPGRRYWVQMARGMAVINGENVVAGDGLAIEEENEIFIKSLDQSEIIIFNLP